MLIQPGHLAIYVAALNRGGAERVAALLATGLFEAGWRISLVVDFEASDNRALVAQQIPVTVLGQSHASATLKLARFLRTERPDIVLAIGGGANVKLAAARVLARSGVPIVLSYHGRSDVGRGRLGHASYTFARRLSRHAGMVCVSYGLADHLCNDWHVPRERITRIYNPVSVERALPVSREALAQRPPIVMSVGRLSPEKGFSALIEALPHLRPDARLVIYGEGPERAALQAQAERLGVAERLELAGYRDDPWPCYATARCFALGSPKEAFGNVVVEALASGLPVVATRSGGPDEILAHGGFGTLVDNSDIPALAGAINHALDDPGDPLPRVAHARTFDVATAVTNYLALFNRILTR